MESFDSIPLRVFLAPTLGAVYSLFLSYWQLAPVFGWIWRLPRSRSPPSSMSGAGVGPPTQSSVHGITSVNGFLHDTVARNALTASVSAVPASMNHIRMR